VFRAGSTARSLNSFVKTLLSSMILPSLIIGLTSCPFNRGRFSSSKRAIAHCEEVYMKIIFFRGVNHPRKYRTQEAAKKYRFIYLFKLKLAILCPTAGKSIRYAIFAKFAVSYGAASSGILFISS
jgi:hypothetical protein